MSLFLKFIILLTMLLGLPLLGIYITGKPIALYLEFPPTTRYVEHPGFSYPPFIGLGMVLFIFLFPFMKRVVLAGKRSLKETGLHPQPRHPFPWWGYAGLVLNLVTWFLAWNRFKWFAALQAHTFSPLWIGYILVINAMTYRRSGRCMLTHQSKHFFILFPVSALFWWFFEYLNRFVQNWYYLDVGRFSPTEYVVLASVSFSTVLPAVLGTRDYLSTFRRFDTAYGNWLPIPLKASRAAGLICLAAAAVGLAGIGVFPNRLYSMLWIAPMLIIVSLQAIWRERHLFSSVYSGNWHTVMTSAFAALICGFFWEMWNYYSFAKWMYAVPYVGGWHVFEMPLLGYAGYLPFGMECTVVSMQIAHLSDADDVAV